MPELLHEPRWGPAAQSLVAGCIDLSHDEDRVMLLVTVCDGLGNELYPAFLRILAIIGQHGDHAARASVAGALVHAIRTGRLPTGRRSAWGASPSATGAIGFASTRSLGPLEYLCAWHAQAEPALAIDAQSFQAAARAVMDLIAAPPEARLLYCEKLLADADDPICGALTRQTRGALRALAATWSAGASSIDASASFLAALAGRHGGSAVDRLYAELRGSGA
jgi:hypothetical protein